MKFYHYYCLVAICLFSIKCWAGDLTIKGSDTMLIMNQNLAQAYMKAHPGANVQVSGGGSGVGLAALRNNTTDIAAASRLIKPKESQDFLLSVGLTPIRFSIALDGVAMFVHKSNKINELTLEQLGKIFHGDYTNWKQVGGDDLPITVYSRETSSGTYSFVKEVVLKDKDYTQRAQTLAGTAQVYDTVANDPKGIGYGGIGYNKGVKLLKVKADESSPGYLPTEDNVDKKIYPLSRSLNYYLNPRTQNEEADKFIKWVRSPEGQKIVAQTYFALPGIVPAKTPSLNLASPSASPLQVSSNPTVEPVSKPPVMTPPLEVNPEPNGGPAPATTSVNPPPSTNYTPPPGVD